MGLGQIVNTLVYLQQNIRVAQFSKNTTQVGVRQFEQPLHGARAVKSENLLSVAANMQRSNTYRPHPYWRNAQAYTNNTEDAIFAPPVAQTGQAQQQQTTADITTQMAIAQQNEQLSSIVYFPPPILVECIAEDVSFPMRSSLVTTQFEKNVKRRKNFGTF